VGAILVVRLSDATRRAIRTFVQLIASSGLTALVSAVVDGLSAAQAVIVLAVWQVIVTYAQNLLEDTTNFPALLKAPASDGVNPEP
jgi:hypothetical protein